MEGDVYPRLTFNREIWCYLLNFEVNYLDRRGGGGSGLTNLYIAQYIVQWCTFVPSILTRLQKEQDSWEPVQQGRRGFGGGGGGGGVAEHTHTILHLDHARKQTIIIHAESIERGRE